MKGLEPPRLMSPEPKSGASANSATPAHILPHIAAAEDLSYVYYHFTHNMSINFAPADKHAVYE